MSSVPKLSVELQPRRYQVAIIPTQPETATASGLVIPDTSKGDKSRQGVVVALGSQVTYIGTHEKVLFRRSAAEEFTLKDTDKKDVVVCFVHEDDVLSAIK